LKFVYQDDKLTFSKLHVFESQDTYKCKSMQSISTLDNERYFLEKMEKVEKVMHAKIYEVL